MEVTLHPKLLKRLEREAAEAGISLNAHISKKLESITPPLEAMDIDAIRKQLPGLIAFLNRVPSVSVMSDGVTADAFWWIKLEIDITHPLAWHAVQHLGFVLNYISINERLPTIFMPVAPPPYLNDGGPETNLSWVIESKFNYIDPHWIEGELENRLPQPVEDGEAWRRGE